MILPFVMLALQAPTGTPQGVSPADQRPVRIWMDAQSPVSRGRTVRLYVQAAAAGNLVVLHYRTDGRIEVLFPARPSDDPRISPGTYEVRGANDAPLWVVSEPDGTGMILAALSPDPVWFDEFSHEAVWTPDALRASWGGADAASALTDVVQRMLGDGAFNYDVLSYTVAPQAIAQAEDSTVTSDQQASCSACGGTEYQFFVSARVFRDHRRVGRGGEPPRAASAPRPAVATPIVLPIRPQAASPAAPRPVVVTPRRRAEEPIGTRTRVEPLMPRRSATGFGGAAPELRSSLTLRHIRTRGTMANEVGGAGHAALLPTPAPARVGGGGIGAPVVAAPMVMRLAVGARQAAPAPVRMAPRGPVSVAAAEPRLTPARGGVRGTWYVGGGRHR